MMGQINSNGRSWCWIGDGEHVGPQYVHQIVKHGGGLVMIWECITTFKKNSCGALHRIIIWIQVG